MAQATDVAPFQQPISWGCPSTLVKQRIMALRTPALRPALVLSLGDRVPRCWQAGKTAHKGAAGDITRAEEI